MQKEVTLRKSANESRNGSAEGRTFTQARSESAKLLMFDSVNAVQTIDFKNIVFLRRFMTEQGKILSRRLTGIPAKHQRKIAKAIKHARLLGLLQFVHIK